MKRERNGATVRERAVQREKKDKNKNKIKIMKNVIKQNHGNKIK